MAARTTSHPIQKRTGSLRGPQRAGVHAPEQHQAPIFVIGVPAIKRPARCFGGSTTTPSQTMKFAVCPLTQDRTILNSSVSYTGRISPDFGGNNSVRP